MSRQAAITRTTSETDIRLSLDLDGRGEHRIETGIPFLDHMLAQVARHGRFDLRLQAKGDLPVDLHHTVEDVGITLGDAVSQALGDKAGIVRYGAARVPMDESLASAVIDLSGRPFLVFQAPQLRGGRIGDFDADLVQEFFQGLTNHLRANLHVQVEYGQNLHHMVEAAFKALGRALDQATLLDPRVAGVVPSTKGTLA
ncbi:MAG TPA: imidazoleglycerol-phosphate dehydratase HisB [Candidatus Methylomirabilis sp.]|nr:imidazoleglycerol-phosphate dehydratase HisB [Candidatus Methylomirabilis sp.]